MNILTPYHRVFDKAAIMTNVNANDTAVKRAHLLQQLGRARNLRIDLVDACELVCIRRATYYRWKRAVQQRGLHGLEDGRKDNKRMRVGLQQRLIRERVEQLRGEYPYAKNKFAILVARTTGLRSGYAGRARLPLLEVATRLIHCMSTA